MVVILNNIWAKTTLNNCFFVFCQIIFGFIFKKERIFLKSWISAIENPIVLFLSEAINNKN